MESFPELNELKGRFERRELHAAHSGRELMKIFGGIVAESKAESSEGLVLELYRAVDYLLPNMPAYAPPINALHHLLSVVERTAAKGGDLEELKDRVASLELEYRMWSEEARARIAAHVFDLIPEGAEVFTFTLSETVSTTLAKVWERGKRFRVFVTESRPNYDGLITAKKLAELGVPVTVSIDACMPDLIGGCQLMLAGAEAVLWDGSVICKVGTRLAGWAARERGIPIYILADTTKFDVSSMFGIQHPLEPIRRMDIPELELEANIRVAGYLFDRTSGAQLRGIVCEQGVLSPLSCMNVMKTMETSSELLERLKARATS